MDIQKLFKDAQNDTSLLANIDVNELLNSIENKNNDYLENKSLSNIHDEKYNAIKELGLDENTIKNYCDKLTEYRLVDEVYELHKSKHVRWINIEDDRELKLKPGGIVVDIKFLDNGTHILCLIGGNRFIQYKFDKCLTFQKLSMEEQLILMAYENI